ncbi:MAG: hypothetical protein RIC55_20015 [Pirellulaceae bacterium]
MNPSNDSLTSLHRRLEKLERQNRLLRRVGFAAMILVVVAVVSGQARRTSREVAAEAFLLLDAEGKTRGELVMAEDGPLLRLLDAEGQPRATLSGGSKTALVLYDAAGKPRVSTAAMEAEAGLSIFDEEGRPQAKVAVAGGRPALDLFEDGKRRVAVGVARGDAAAALLSEAGHPQAMMSVGKDSAGKETAAYALRDPNGNPQFVATARKEGTMLSLFDLQGDKSVSRLTITANEVGTGYFIKDAQGKLRMQLQMSEGKSQFSLFDENGANLFSKP